MTTISVIIPTYNRKEMLEETLQSIRNSRGETPEIIVIDDGSTDGTAEFLAAQPDVIHRIQKNGGPSKARNLGASMASGDYLAFLDSDDLWFPWTLDIYRKIISETSATFIAGRPFRFEQTETLTQAVEVPAQSLSFQDYLASGDEWRWWGCSSFVIQRKAFIKAGSFCSKWINAEDADMALRLGTAPGFVQITAPHTFAYREHAVSEMKKGDKTLSGIHHLLATEESGDYPGGKERAKERRRILSRHLRPVCLSLLATQQKPEAWNLFKRTLGWNISLNRWRFIAGFLLKAIKP